MRMQRQPQIYTGAAAICPDLKYSHCLITEQRQISTARPSQSRSSMYRSSLHLQLVPSTRHSPHASPLMAGNPARCCTEEMTQEQGQGKGGVCAYSTGAHTCVNSFSRQQQHFQVQASQIHQPGSPKPQLPAEPSHPAPQHQHSSSSDPTPWPWGSGLNI